MGIYRCLWMFMSIYGYLLSFTVVMGTYEDLWVSVNFYGCYNFYGFLGVYGRKSVYMIATMCTWLSMGVYGYLWVSMGIYGCLYLLLHSWMGSTLRREDTACFPLWDTLLWIYIVVYRRYMGIYVRLGVYECLYVCYGYLWICMRVYGYLWASMSVCMYNFGYMSVSEWIWVPVGFLDSHKPT